MKSTSRCIYLLLYNNQYYIALEYDSTASFLSLRSTNDTPTNMYYVIIVIDHRVFFFTEILKINFPFDFNVSDFKSNIMSAEKKIDSFLVDPLEKSDPEMYALIQKEKKRQVNLVHAFIQSFIVSRFNSGSRSRDDCIGKFYISWRFGSSRFLLDQQIQ